MRRKPGQTLKELVGRILQDAVTCDFLSIRDPLDKPMRTSFIFCVDNEAVLKALFNHKDDEFTFIKAYHVEQETEEDARVDKEMVFGTTSRAPIRCKV